MYGLETHHDWFRFLDEEIINVLPEKDKELLATLAQQTNHGHSCETCQWDGPPPKALIEHGLVTERADGMWIHEALKEIARGGWGCCNRSEQECLIALS